MLCSLKNKGWLPPPQKEPRDIKKNLQWEDNWVLVVTSVPSTAQKPPRSDTSSRWQSQLSHQWPQQPNLPPHAQPQIAAGGLRNPTRFQPISNCLGSTINFNCLLILSLFSQVLGYLGERSVYLHVGTHTPACMDLSGVSSFPAYLLFSGPPRRKKRREDAWVLGNSPYPYPYHQ